MSDSEFPAIFLQSENMCSFSTSWSSALSPLYPSLILTLSLEVLKFVVDVRREMKLTEMTLNYYFLIFNFIFYLPVLCIFFF